MEQAQPFRTRYLYDRGPDQSSRGKELGQPVEASSPLKWGYLPALHQGIHPFPLEISIFLEPWLSFLGLGTRLGSEHRAIGSCHDSYSWLSSLVLYVETSHPSLPPKTALITTALEETLSASARYRDVGCPLPRLKECLKYHRHCKSVHLFLNSLAAIIKGLVLTKWIYYDTFSQEWE